MVKALTAAAGAAVISALCTQFILTSVLWWPLLLWCAGTAFVFSCFDISGRTMLILGVLAVAVGLLSALVPQLLFIPFIFFVFGVGAVTSSLAELIVPVSDG